VEGGCGVHRKLRNVVVPCELKGGERKRKRKKRWGERGWKRWVY
jgi:hypothetical protein